MPYPLITITIWSFFSHFHSYFRAQVHWTRQWICVCVTQPQQTTQTHKPPLASPSPSCSPRWPSAVSGHRLCAVVPPANHTHKTMFANLRHTTTESGSKGQIADQSAISKLKGWIFGGGNWTQQYWKRFDQLHLFCFWFGPECAIAYIQKKSCSVKG